MIDHAAFARQSQAWQEYAAARADFAANPCDATRDAAVKALARFNRTTIPHKTYAGARVQLETDLKHQMDTHLMQIRTRSRHYAP